MTYVKADALKSLDDWRRIQADLPGPRGHPPVEIGLKAKVR
ncbi:hypothetical protein [Bradyrhizobium jicamae]|nr:hypothetical protein [Bradyrhizobium jicamae]